MKIAVLISGRGSNMAALAASMAADDHPASLVLVLSNRPEAQGLELAREAGLTTVAVDHKAYDSKTDFEAALQAELEAHGVEFVCLAGFMRLFSNDFVARWRDRMINIHPSLLPAYKGLDTHARAIEDGVRFAGCTLHFVRAEMDTGPIIAQAVVPVYPGESAEELAARTLVEENRLYPRIVRMIAEGRVRVSGQRVQIDGAIAADTTLTFPAGE